MPSTAEIGRHYDIHIKESVCPLCVVNIEIIKRMSSIFCVNLLITMCIRETLKSLSEFDQSIYPDVNSQISTAK